MDTTLAAAQIAHLLALGRQLDAGIALLGRHPQVGCGTYLDPDTRERVVRIPVGARTITTP